MMDAIRLACVSAENARLPVSISSMTTPKAKMSVTASAGLPSSCSGPVCGCADYHTFAGEVLCFCEQRCLAGYAHFLCLRLYEPEVEQSGADRREHHVCRL